MQCFAPCGFLYILNLHLLDDLVLFSVIVQQSIKIIDLFVLTLRTIISVGYSCIRKIL